MVSILFYTNIVINFLQALSPICMVINTVRNFFSLLQPLKYEYYFFVFWTFLLRKASETKARVKKNDCKSVISTTIGVRENEMVERHNITSTKEKRDG